MPDWVKNIDVRIIDFINSLNIDNHSGKYIPCLKGVTEEGKKASLGFSCFALRIFYMLGKWKLLDKKKQDSWIAFIQSFQYTNSFLEINSVKKYAFIDPVLFKYLNSNYQKKSFLYIINEKLNPFYKKNILTEAEKAIIAETKQALATLNDIGIFANKPYTQFPKKTDEVYNYMKQFDWSQPWSSGGQTAALSVFFYLEGSKIMSDSKLKSLQNSMYQFYTSIADKATGAYFLGDKVDQSMIINGAMKILTALKWLNQPIHFPKELINTTLKKLPKEDGCYLVDAIYVLYRCSSETNYKKKEINNYCLSVLDMIKRHHNSDGGFSYNIGAAQKSYYGLPISIGYNESDLHGTFLLTWAILMILDILGIDILDQQLIQP